MSDSDPSLKTEYVLAVCKVVNNNVLRRLANNSGLQRDNDPTKNKKIRFECYELVRMHVASVLHCILHRVVRTAYYYHDDDDHGEPIVRYEDMRRAIVAALDRSVLWRAEDFIRNQPARCPAARNINNNTNNNANDNSVTGCVLIVRTWFRKYIVAGFCEWQAASENGGNKIVRVTNTSSLLLQVCVEVEIMRVFAAAQIIARLSGGNASRGRQTIYPEDIKAVIALNVSMTGDTVRNCATWLIFRHTTHDDRKFSDHQLDKFAKQFRQEPPLSSVNRPSRRGNNNQTHNTATRGRLGDRARGRKASNPRSSSSNINININNNNDDDDDNNNSGVTADRAPKKSRMRMTSGPGKSSSSNQMNRAPPKRSKSVSPEVVFTRTVTNVPENVPKEDRHRVNVVRVVTPYVTSPMPANAKSKITRIVLPTSDKDEGARFAWEVYQNGGRQTPNTREFPYGYSWNSRTETVAASTPLDRNSIQRLRHNGWLDDHTIHCFCNLIAYQCSQAMTERRIFLLTTIESSTALARRNNASMIKPYVKRMARLLGYQTYSPGDHKWVLMPVNIGDSHWIVMAFDTETGTWWSYDSLNHEHEGVAKNLFLGLKETMGWKHTSLIYSRGRMPMQDDGHSCGVWTCMTIMFFCMRWCFANQLMDNVDMRRDFIKRARMYIAYTVFYNALRLDTVKFVRS